MRPPISFSYLYDKNLYEPAHMLERLLTRSFNYAAEDMPSIKAAARHNTIYELPLNGLRPAKGWKNRLADFADVALAEYVSPLTDITPAQVKNSKAYQVFCNVLYDNGLQIDDITTTEVKPKIHLPHSMAKITVSNRKIQRYISR